MRQKGIEDSIIQILEESLRSVFEDIGVHPPSPLEARPELEIPKEKTHGDLSTNIAMKAAKVAHRPPLELAGLLKTKAEKNVSAPNSPLKKIIEKLEVKEPGFINFFFDKNYLGKVLLGIIRRKADFGRSSLGAGLKLQIEFVSANPTGPLTIAHARQAAIGDSLANILAFSGYDVKREYYLNDEGTQMNILAGSIRARYRALLGLKEEFPADGYKGVYIIDIANDFKKRYGKKFLKTEDLKPFMEFGLRRILADIKEDLKSFGVKFDVWYSQRDLRKSGKVKKALGLLKDKGYIYEKEGAVWFRSTAFGDDKDRVVIKSDGNMTYLAPDMAYHLDKYRRGFKRLIDIWGPDHHGYVPRMKAAIQALGYKPETLSVLIVQLATLYRAGTAVSMSTRAGEFVTLREVREEVGKDVARFVLLMRRLSSHLDFDLENVKKESMENPVYYIQYAHARICSINDYARKIKVDANFHSGLLKEAEEVELLRMLQRFPAIVALSGKTLEPYVILQYLQDLAGIFHSFYNKHRVVGDDPDLTKARLVLVACVKVVLANGLRLLGVSLPEKM